MHNDLVFCSNRQDRLGARLTAIANVSFLAKRYGGRFLFEWRKRRDLALADSIFEQSVLQEHMVGPDELEARHLSISLDSKTVCNVLCTFQKKDVHGTVFATHPFGIYREPEDDPGTVRRGISARVKGTLLRKDLLETFEKAKSHFPAQYTGVHLRRGDLISWLSRPENDFEAFLRYIPSQVVEHLSREGKQPIIFTDSPELLPDSIKQFSMQNMVPGALRDGLDDTQNDLLDMFLLGSAEEIHAGKSAYSSCASIIGGAEIIHPMELLGTRGFFATFASEKSAPFTFTDRQISASMNAAAGFLSRTQPDSEMLYDSLALFEETYPEDERIALRWGHIYTQRAEYEKAVEMFQKVLASTECLEASVGLARLFNRLGEIQKRNEVVACAGKALKDAAVLQNLKKSWGIPG